MNPDKTYTYNKDDFKWTMDDIVTEKYETTDSQPAKWRLLPELPFWWFLNPWKHVEQLHETLRDAVNDCNDWHRKYDQTVYDLQNELETVKAERDAANDAVRTLRKKGKRRG